VPPPSGIGELADALEAHRERTDLAERRARARRGAALREFAAEHGERALRELGGRRGVERLLEAQDGSASVGELLELLEAAR
jgi:LAO/AO transport system kinase